MTTGRTSFNETFLSEMPRGIGSFELFDMIEYNINDLKRANVPIESVSSCLYKIDQSQTAYYWYESGGVIQLGIELEKKPYGWVIRATGKNPKFRGQPPWASELYAAVLRDTGRPIRILSDTDLSDEGFSIWKRLYKLGLSISVYDRENPGNSFQTIGSVQDFENFFKDDDALYKRYQFVLTESTGVTLAETTINFRWRRHRELIGSTED